MASKRRIKDISVTASAPAADDWIALDGNDEGTRRLDPAYFSSSQRAANVAALTATLKSRLTNNTAVNVLGYYAADDGGGGLFVWDAASTATANGGTVFAADEGGTGRWLRVLDDSVISAAWFGFVAAGPSNTARLQAAVDAVSDEVLLPGGSYAVGTITLTRNTKLRGVGTVFTGASAFATATFSFEIYGVTFSGCMATTILSGGNIGEDLTRQLIVRNCNWLNCEGKGIRTDTNTQGSPSGSAKTHGYIEISDCVWRDHAIVGTASNPMCIELRCAYENAKLFNNQFVNIGKTSGVEVANRAISATSDYSGTTWIFGNYIDGVYKTQKVLSGGEFSVDDDLECTGIIIFGDTAFVYNNVVKNVVGCNSDTDYTASRQDTEGIYGKVNRFACYGNYLENCGSNPPKSDDGAITAKGTPDANGFVYIEGNRLVNCGCGIIVTPTQCSSYVLNNNITGSSRGISLSGFEAAGLSRTMTGNKVSLSGIFAHQLWETGTAYVIGQRVSFGGRNYVVEQNHTSSFIATDLTNGDLAYEYNPSDGAFSIWQTGTSYTAGGFFWFDYNIYEVLVTHTSSSIAEDIADGDIVLRYSLFSPLNNRFLQSFISASNGFVEDNTIRLNDGSGNMRLLVRSGTVDNCYFSAYASRIFNDATIAVTCKNTAFETSTYAPVIFNSTISDVDKFLEFDSCTFIPYQSAPNFQNSSAGILFDVSGGTGTGELHRPRVRFRNTRINVNSTVSVSLVRATNLSIKELSFEKCTIENASVSGGGVLRVNTENTDFIYSLKDTNVINFRHLDFRSIGDFDIIEIDGVNHVYDPLTSARVFDQLAALVEKLVITNSTSNGGTTLIGSTTTGSLLRAIINDNLENTIYGVQSGGIIATTSRSNTAQAGGSSTITLDAGASAADDFYNGMEVKITGGTGEGQSRVISDYDGTSKVATTLTNWSTNPDGTSTFDVISYSKRISERTQNGTPYVVSSFYPLQ